MTQIINRPSKEILRLWFRLLVRERDFKTIDLLYSCGQLRTQVVFIHGFVKTAYNIGFDKVIQ